MNHVTLVGRITQNLVLRETKSGKSYVFFTVAVNDISNNAHFINCVAWNKTAENMAKYIGKGSLISIAGRLTTRKDNRDQTIMEVQANNVNFLESRQKRDYNNKSVSNIEQPKTNLQENTQVNIDEAFQNQNTENYDTEISFVNNNSLDTDDSDDEAIIWD